MSSTVPISDKSGSPMAAFQEPDLTGWLGGHDVMRTQFGLLADAATDVSLSETLRIAALEDHVAFMTRRLTWHHGHEDAEIWPALRRADSSLDDLLDDLEQDHERLDDLLALCNASDESLPRRAPVLRELHRQISAHFLREETEVVPVIRRVIPASAWALGDRRFEEELGADRGMALAWLIGHLPVPARPGFLAELPPLVRELYETEWRPTHIGQVALMYGSEAAQSL